MAPGLFLCLLDMHVVVDVLRAVAVIAVALGAVPELHVRVIRVRNTADCALMEIAPALLDLLLGLFEVDGLGVGPIDGPLSGPADHRHQIVPEEDKVVQQGHQGQDRRDPLAGEDAEENVKGEHRSIQASHFTFMGKIPISSTCISGYRVAKAKNMDILM